LRLIGALKKTDSSRTSIEFTSLAKKYKKTEELKVEALKKKVVSCSLEAASAGMDISTISMPLQVLTKMLVGISSNIQA
jgi:hypothetical protein